MQKQIIFPIPYVTNFDIVRRNPAFPYYPFLVNIP